MNLKVQPAGKYKVLTFYKYVPLPHAEEIRDAHLLDADEIGIKGRILISPEGINGAASGTLKQTDMYIKYLHTFPELKDLTFRVQYSHYNTFTKLHVRLKDEVVNSGLPELNPIGKIGEHIDAHRFRELKNDPDVVLLDVRSNYEHKIGRFKNAVTLDIDNFREFPDKIDELRKYKNKKIITYCTGGVKCEKASAYLRENGFESVYQLKGGIVQYANDTGGEDFEGRCYVFDKRVAVDVNRINPLTISVCTHCKRVSARLINCVKPECNEQVVMCPSCSYKWQGACSKDCFETTQRSFNGTGYYEKSGLM